LHAGVVIAEHARAALERLCRYGARPAFAHERLAWTAEGQIAYRLKRPWPDGRTHLVLPPVAFLRRLCGPLRRADQMVARQPDAQIHRRRQIEPVDLLVVERAIELVEPARQRRRLEVRTAEVLPQRLERPPRVRRRPGRRHHVPLQMVDHQAESIAQRAHRLGELARDLHGHTAGDASPRVVARSAHRLPVSRNQLSVIPPSSRPRDAPISKVPGMKWPKNASTAHRPLATRSSRSASDMPIRGATKNRCAPPS
jgi:hypothetical protein